MRKIKIDMTCYNLIRVLYCLIMASAIVMFGLIEFKIYNGEKIHEWYNYVAIIVAVLALVIVFFFLRREKICLEITKNTDKIMLVITFLLLIIQIFICSKIYFVTGWDSYIMLSNSWYMANGWTDILDNSYFSTYPNNLFLLMIYTWIFKICKIFKFEDINYYFFVIVCINCLINSVSCYLVYNVLAKLRGKMAGIIGFVVAIFLFGLSAWNVVCYSDQWALIFPIGMLALMLHKPKDKYKYVIKYFAIILLAAIGIKIKPQVFIFFIAMWIIQAISHLNKSKYKKIILDICLLTVTLCCTFLLGIVSNLNADKHGLVLDENKNFGIAHYLMMGLNLETCGSYSESDVAYSRSFETKQERNIENIKIAKERFEEYGVKGTSKLFLDKLGITYSDGLFSWGGEGNFYYIIPDKNDSQTEWLRKIYYNNEMGDNHKYYSQVIQVIWAGTLILCFLSGIVDSSKKYYKEKIVVYLAIIGVSIYEMIFETRSRYIYGYTPLFCVLAVNGFYSVQALLCKYKSKEQV